MPRPLALHVEIGGVSAVQVPHDLRKVSTRRLKQQVVVIRHQAIRMNHCVVAFDGGLKVGEKLFPVPTVFEYLLLLVITTANKYINVA